MCHTDEHLLHRTVDIDRGAREFAIVRSAMVDTRRRVVMPPEGPPGSTVTIQALDETTWLIRRKVPARDYKCVMIPVVSRLPDEAELDEVEEAFGRAAYSKLPPPKQ